MSGKTSAPHPSSGILVCHRPRMPPIGDGDAESRYTLRPRQGIGRARETQSIAFLRAPETE